MLGPLGRRHVSVHMLLKLLTFFNISMCVRQEFDSDGDFKRKVWTQIWEPEMDFDDEFNNVAQTLQIPMFQLMLAFLLSIFH